MHLWQLLFYRSSAVWLDPISVFSVGVICDPAYRTALCLDRHNILAAHSQYRFIQLLLYFVSDAALFVLGRIFPAASEIIARLAVGCRGVAAASSGSIGA